jgi:hypothetical protein
MRGHLPALDHGVMDPAPAPYMIRISGHLGATMLSAFPAMAPQHYGAYTVLTGLLDQSALYGVLAEIEALGLDLLEVRRLTADRELDVLTGALRLCPVRRRLRRGSGSRPGRRAVPRG